MRQSRERVKRQSRERVKRQSRERVKRGARAHSPTRLTRQVSAAGGRQDYEKKAQLWLQTGSRLATDWLETGYRLAAVWPQTGHRLALLPASSPSIMPVLV